MASKMLIKTTFEIVLKIPKLVKHTPNYNLRDVIEKPTLDIVENKPFELMKQVPNDGLKDDHEKLYVENP